MMSPELINLCASKALEAAGAGARALLDVITASDEELHIESKLDGSLVSDADFASQKVIAEILEPLKIPILSEEAKAPEYSTRRDWEFFWLVDPLDGTESFLKSRSGFAVNIALCDNSGPIIGVVADPLTNTIYYGVEGMGFSICQLDGSNSRRVVTLKARKPFRLVTSWNEKATVNTLTPPGINPKDVVARPVSGALKFCELALGEAEIHSRTGPYMEWDCAAGDGILRSIGIDVIDRNTGARIKYNTKDLRVNGLYCSRV
jgi:3'(2'), 5'-bisphosphate nucleotidase